MGSMLTTDRLTTQLVQTFSHTTAKQHGERNTSASDELPAWPDNSAMCSDYGNTQSPGPLVGGSMARSDLVHAPLGEKNGPAGLPQNSISQSSKPSIGPPISILSPTGPPHGRKPPPAGHPQSGSPYPSGTPQNNDTQVLSGDNPIKINSHGYSGSMITNCDINIGRHLSHNHNEPMTDINRIVPYNVCDNKLDSLCIAGDGEPQNVCDRKVNSTFNTRDVDLHKVCDGELNSLHSMGDDEPRHDCDNKMDSSNTGDDEFQSDKATTRKSGQSVMPGNAEHASPGNIVMASSTVDIDHISVPDHKDRSPISGCVTATVELMVHPGYPCDPINEVGGCGCGPDDFSQSQDRLHEMHVLTSFDVLNFYRQQGYKLVPSCAGD